MSGPAEDWTVASGHDLDAGSHPGVGRLLGRVAGNEPLGSLTWLTIDAPGWRGARPGQFALLQAEPSRCFLTRALSIAEEVGERVSFLVAPVGDGTRELCGLGIGDEIWVLGPLGNGFDLEEMLGETPSGDSGAPAEPATVSSGGARLVIVAGGVGAAPLPFLLSRLVQWFTADMRAGAPTGARRRSRSGVVVLLGFRDALQAQGATPVRRAVSLMQEPGLLCRVAVVVEDGSHGPAEQVTDLLARHLLPGDRLVACGPPAMSAAVWRVCSSVPDVRAWFSLEAGMACGVGSCHGCALTLADGSFARVCHDGPVFAGESVFGPMSPSSDREGQRT